MAIVIPSMATLSACVVRYIDLSLRLVLVASILPMRKARCRRAMTVVKYKHDERAQPIPTDQSVRVANLCFVQVLGQLPAHPDTLYCCIRK